jgi:hypothetical protein
MSNDHCSIFNNTFVDITDDAIFNSSTNYGYLFSGNYFYNVGGYCFGNSATNGNATALIQNNAYYNSPNRIEAPGNMTEFDAVVETSDEFVDKANGDYTLKATSGGYGYGIGGYWSLPMTDYSDIGAIQHVPVVDSSQPQEAGTQVMPFGQWAVTNPEAQLHPLRSS